MKGIIRKIAHKFDENNIRYDIGDLGQIIFENRIGNTNNGLLYVIYPSEEDENFGTQHIHVCTNRIGHIDTPLVAVYKCLNDLNNQYNFFKFFIDSENGICIKADIIVPYNDSEESILELVVRMVRVVEETYPTIMKTVWG